MDISVMYRLYIVIYESQKLAAPIFRQNCPFKISWLLSFLLLLRKNYLKYNVFQTFTDLQAICTLISFYLGLIDMIKNTYMFFSGPTRWICLDFDLIVWHFDRFWFLIALQLWYDNSAWQLKVRFKCIWGDVRFVCSL